jgi:hypothetical protein
MFVSRRTLPLTGIDPLAVGLDHGSDLAEIRGRNCSREPGEVGPFVACSKARTYAIACARCAGGNRRTRAARSSGGNSVMTHLRPPPM